MSVGEEVVISDEIDASEKAARRKDFLKKIFKGIKHPPSRAEIESFTTAAGFNDVDALREKMERHGKYILNETDSNGHTALYHACRGSAMESFEYLLSVGADVNEENNLTHMTPLMVCARRGDATKAWNLIMEGANVLCRDTDGKSAADHAEENGDQTLVKNIKSCMDKAYEREREIMLKGLQIQLSAQKLRLQPKK